MTLSIDKSNWTKVKFGSVIDNIANRVDNPSEAEVDRYVGLEHLDPGTMTISRWGTPDQVEATKLLFKKGDVIFGRRRAYQKKVSMANFDGICSAHALVLRGKPGLIDPLFLPVFLSSNAFLDRAIKISVGSLSPTVNWKTLATQEFQLPPIKQQGEIAQLFWKIEEHLQNLQRLIQALTLYLDLFLADLRNGSFLEKSLAPFDILELNQVADLNWGDMQTTKSAYQSDGYVTYSAAGPDGFMKTYDYDGDGIVLSAIGAECGKTWLASGKWSCIKNTMRIFTLNESKIAIRYLFWITNAKSVWPKRGSAQPFISQEDARKIKLNVPNIDFQLKTLTFIDEIVEAANFVVKEHSTLTKLRDAAYSTIFEVSRDA